MVIILFWCLYHSFYHGVTLCVSSALCRTCAICTDTLYKILSNVILWPVASLVHVRTSNHSIIFPLKIWAQIILKGLLCLFWQSPMLYKIVTVAFAAAAYELILPGSCLRKSHDLLAAVRILSEKGYTAGGSCWYYSRTATATLQDKE